MPVEVELEQRNNSDSSGGSGGSGQSLKDFIAELYAQVNPNDRNTLLGNGFVFDFLAAQSFGGGGRDGGVILADNTLFPGVVGNGLSWLVGFLGPCGMVAPHNHPRASEYLFNIAGPPLAATSFQENGSPIFSGQVAAGDVIVLPQGSVHFVSNTGCDPVFITAGFNSETPGVGFLSSMYTSMDPQTINAAFGQEGTVFDANKIPGAVNLGQAECLSKCGINPDTFNINGKISNKDLMKQAFAGFLKAEGFDFDSYNSSMYQQYN
ncbi:hypothetical protein CcaverHIS641_0703540 [Cutaneotrichosporon cavernicola]|nr:hypothetical protein CcaverHIS641_0703540 [Cutaneotrichosporon cavernicola]